MEETSKKSETETDKKPIKEDAEKAWGQNPTLGNEITPSDVLKQQEKKK